MALLPESITPLTCLMNLNTDIDFMRRALVLARRGLGRTSPNPCVGAILVQHGKVIGKGWHRGAGCPHAEVEAIGHATRAGRKTRGATLYVTLEPCCTWGRTPPCADAIQAAGIRRVVAGATDLNPKHAGRGFKLLKKRGIQVVEGVLRKECEQLNQAWNHWVVHRTPWIIAKCGMTLDGKIAAVDGESRWITSEKARVEAHRLRSRVDAILVGVNTVLKDDPLLTVRLSRWHGRQPLRVILDTHARTPTNARILNRIGRDPRYAAGSRLAEASGVVRVGEASKSRPYGDVWIMVGRDVPMKRVERLRQSGAKVISVPNNRRGLDLNAIFKKLGAAEIVSVLAEGGGNVLGSFFSEGKVHEAVFFIAPMILGGRQSVQAVAGDGFPEWRKAPMLRDFCLRKVGGDLMVTGMVNLTT